MAILAECPACRKKQSLRNKICKCGESIDKAKRSRRIKYWIYYRLPNGKQKRENRIFDILPESKITFNELTKWYLKLPSVKNLSSCGRIELALDKFNKVYGNQKINNIKLTELEGYQIERAGQQGSIYSEKVFDIELKKSFKPGTLRVSFDPSTTISIC